MSHAAPESPQTPAAEGQTPALAGGTDPTPSLDAPETQLRITAVISLLVALFGAGVFATYAVEQTRRDAAAEVAAAAGEAERLRTALAEAQPQPAATAREPANGAGAAAVAVDAETARLRNELATARARLAALERAQREAPKTQPSGSRRADTVARERRVEELTEQVAELQRALAQRQQALETARADLARARQETAQLQRDYAALGARHTPEGVQVTLGESALRFAPGAAVLPGAPPPGLERLAAVLAHHPDMRVALRGHTDSTGAEAANRSLSRRRAEAVRRALTELGIAPGRIAVEARGESEPIAENATAEGRRRNRRVEILLLDADAFPGGAG